MAPETAASVKKHWSKALEHLKAIAAAATDKSLTQQQLLDTAQQAEHECDGAFSHTPLQALRYGQPKYHPEIRQALVDDLQVPAHLAQALSSLLSTPSTLTAAAQLSKHLTKLLQALEPLFPELRTTSSANPEPTLQQNTTGNSLAIAKQLSGSGLLKQLRAA